jgi:periplasmic protein TonB
MRPGILFSAALAVLVMAASAHAQAPGAPASPVRIVEHPDWVSIPSAEQLAKFYPSPKTPVNGRADLACTVTADGRLADCKVTAEDPTDKGFGPAALKLTKFFRMRTTTSDGAPVAGAMVRVPVRFINVAAD